MQKLKTGSRQNKKRYFTETHEQAILDFVEEKEHKKREIIYKELLQPVFKEMIEKIVFTYRYTTIPNIEMLKEDCQVFLVTILGKYKKSKGSAFSYFSVVTKNWFIHKKKKLATRREVNYEDYALLSSDEKFLEEFSPEEAHDEQQFWFSLREEIDKWDDETLNLTENERLVITAIKTLFDNIDDLEIISRKSIYLYLREISGLPTKKIVIVLAKLKKKYFLFKRKWNTEIF
jgi:hypothetical protein